MNRKPGGNRSCCLGASVSSVVTTLSKDFLKLVMLAMLIAIPVAWIAAGKWLEHYPYRITLSWRMFASAGVLVILIALATVSFQAVKAALANPVKRALPLATGWRGVPKVGKC